MSDTTAIELLKRAVQLDGEEKYPDALTCYTEGIRMLLKAVKGKICLNINHLIFVFIRYSTE
jgi:hypothetical protein